MSSEAGVPASRTDTGSRDHLVTVAELRRAMAEFVEERDWSQFHRPKHLAMSVAIEAAELMEHFQWTNAGESPVEQGDPAARQAVGEEIADVLAYLLSLVNALDLDLATIFDQKLARNRLKYPAEQFRGRASATGA